MDGHEFDSAKTTVDATDEFIDGGPEVLVLLDVLPRRHRELYEDDLADPFRMLGEEEFESMKFLWDTFDIVQAIDADNDLDAAKALLQLRYALFDGLFLEILRACVSLSYFRQSGIYIPE